MRPIPLVMVVVGILVFVAGGFTYKYYMKKEEIAATKSNTEAAQKKAEAVWAELRKETDNLGGVDRAGGVLGDLVSRRLIAWHGAPELEIRLEEIMQGNAVKSRLDYEYTKYNRDRLLALLQLYSNFTSLFKIAPNGVLINFRRSKDAVVDALYAELANKKRDEERALNILNRSRKKAREDEIKLVKKQNSLEEEVIKLGWELDERKKILERLKVTKPSESIGAQGQPLDKDELVSKGAIILVDVNEKSVIIDKGRTKRVKEGWVFQVFSKVGRTGKNLIKGKIRVNKVEKNTSLAAIIETTSGEPMRAGDLITRRGYEPDRVLTFSKVGSLSFSADDLRSLLFKHGYVYSDSVTIKVDYLVKGTYAVSEADIKKIKMAEDFGIKIITEKELRDLLGY